MGLVFVPFSVQPTRRNGSPFSGLVKVALIRLAPLLNLIGLLSGSAPPNPTPSSAISPLISTFSAPRNQASKKNWLRNSASSAPSQTAVNFPAGRKGVGGWP